MDDHAPVLRLQRTDPDGWPTVGAWYEARIDLIGSHRGPALSVHAQLARTRGVGRHLALLGRVHGRRHPTVAVLRDTWRRAERLFGRLA